MGYIKTIREKIGHDRLIVVGGGVFITDGKRVLLQRRIDNGCWAQHGGGMEIGEEIEDTARREQRLLHCRAHKKSSRAALRKRKTGLRFPDEKRTKL